MRGEILDIDTGRFAATYFCYYHHHHTRPIIYRFAPETADLGGLLTVDRSRTSGVGGSLDSLRAASSTVRKFSPIAFSASVQRHGYSASLDSNLGLGPSMCVD